MSDPTVKATLYGGAIRGAKTSLLALKDFIKAVTFPNSRWSIMRADTPRITTNLLPAVSNFYSKPELKKHIKSFNQNTLEFKFKNDSIIKLFPESYSQDKNLSRFLGLEMNGFSFDELSEFQKITYEHAFIRAGSWLNAEPDQYGNYPKASVDGSCNPTKNWVKEEWYDPWIENRLPSHWRYISAKITDNPWVSQEYLDSLRQNMTPINYNRFVGGDWNYQEAVGNEWLYEFNYSNHVKPIQYNPYVQTFLTYDFNVIPYMTLLAFQVIQEHGATYVRFYKEYCLENPYNSAREVTKHWIKEYGLRDPNSKPAVSYCGDASGENRVPGFGEMKAFNEVRRELEPFLHNGSERVFRRKFRNEFARSMLNDILSQHVPIIIEIDELNCPKLIRDLQESREDVDGGLLKEKVKHPITGQMYEKNGHCTDAFKYGLLSVFEQLYLDKYHNRQY